MPKININELNTNIANGLLKLDGSAKAPVANLPVNTANGVAGLDGSSKVATTNLPVNTASGVAGLDSSGILSTAVVPHLKMPVRVATTAALASCTYNGTSKTLTATANGVLAAIDGVTLVVGERVLVKDQATGTQNGIYVVTSVGAVGAPWVLTRASDMSASSDFVPGVNISVTSGTTYSAAEFILTTTGTITLDTTSLTFTRGTAAATTGTVTSPTTGLKVQAGVYNLGGSGGTANFSPAFSSITSFVAAPYSGGSGNVYIVDITNVSNSSASFNCYDRTGASATFAVYWIAVGT